MVSRIYKPSTFLSVTLATTTLGLVALNMDTANAASLTPGNILVSTNNTVTEYTPDGVVVQSFAIPHPSNEDGRDLVVDSQGNIRVYNGTFDPILTTIDTLAATTSSTTLGGWSTTNNLTYGGITSFQDKVFVTDMRTFGDGGADEAQGIVVFDGADTDRFATDIDPIDLNLGLDGLLYALSPGGSPSGRTVSVYDPSTLGKIRDIDLTGNGSIGFGSQRRAIAVNGAGELFIATLGGTNNLFHLDAMGGLLNATSFNCGRFSCRFADLDINTQGTLLLTTPDGDVLTTDETFTPPTFLIEDAEFGERFATFVPEPESVPEPSSLLGLVCLGLLPLGNWIRQQRN